VFVFELVSERIICSMEWLAALWALGGKFGQWLVQEHTTSANLLGRERRPRFP
jgi:hypothetical protein